MNGSLFTSVVVRELVGSGSQQHMYRRETGDYRFCHGRVQHVQHKGTLHEGVSRLPFLAVAVGLGVVIVSDMRFIFTGYFWAAVAELLSGERAELLIFMATYSN